jgi:hypothetical protein
MKVHGNVVEIARLTLSHITTRDSSPSKRWVVVESPLPAGMQEL